MNTSCRGKTGITKDMVSAKLRELTDELYRSYPSLLISYPIHSYVKDIKNYSGYYNYSFVSPKWIRICDEIEDRYSAHVLALYHKLSLAALMVDAVGDLTSQHFPSVILALYDEWLDRAYGDLFSQPDSFYHHRNHDFRKDIAVFGHRAVPVGGAWIVELSRVKTDHLVVSDSACRGGEISGKTLVVKRLRKSISTFLFRVGLHKVLWSFFEKRKGNSFYYAVHTVDRYLPRFTKEQMNKAYMNIAELLEVNPEICGVFRRSWFLDPSLQEISPALRFLWEIPQQNGAVLFRTRTSDDDLRNAISMSLVRQRLYKEGKYTPTTYAYVWPRKEFLLWVGNMSEGG